MASARRCDRGANTLTTPRESSWKSRHLRGCDSISFKHMELGQGPDGLNEVKHKAGPTSLGIGVKDAQTGVQPYGQRGQVPFRLQEVGRGSSTWR